MEIFTGILPSFQNFVRCEKDLNDNKHNSLHLGRKIARIFVFGLPKFARPPNFLFSSHFLALP